MLGAQVWILRQTLRMEYTTKSIWDYGKQFAVREIYTHIYAQFISKCIRVKCMARFILFILQYISYVKNTSQAEARFCKLELYIYPKYWAVKLYQRYYNRNQILTSSLAYSVNTLIARVNTYQLKTCKWVGYSTKMRPCIVSKRCINQSDDDKLNFTQQIPSSKVVLRYVICRLKSGTISVSLLIYSCRRCALRVVCGRLENLSE